jgi:hypothetical protein
MSRLKSNLITAGIVLGLLILLIIGFLFVPFRSGDAVQVSFLGYTNDLSGIKLALFVVTNTSNERISYSQFTPEIQTLGSWSIPKCTHVPILVLAHGIDNYTTPAITNAVVWRVSVLWQSNDQTPMEIWRNKLMGNLSWNWHELQRRQWPRYYPFSGERYYLSFSAAITNK